MNFEYRQFLNDKILSFLPTSKVKVNDKYNFRCPICGDSLKSKTKARGWYYLSTATYHCFNCDMTLSGIKFLEYLSGENYENIKQEYIRLYLKSGFKNNSLSAHTDIPKENEIDLFKLESAIRPNWRNPISETAKQYLNNRRLLEAPFLSDPLYSVPNKDGTGEYILIPWVINGVEAYFQLNDYQKLGSIKYIYPKGKHKLIYGLDNIDPSWKYIICFEGCYDSCFVKNGIGLGTKTITDKQLKIIKQRYPHHKIVLSFDNDGDGINAFRKYIDSGKDFSYFIWFNKNTKQKDINDYVVFKNKVDLFTDKIKLEKMIYKPLQAKILLASYPRVNSKYGSKKLQCRVGNSQLNVQKNI